MAERALQRSADVMIRRSHHRRQGRASRCAKVGDLTMIYVGTASWAIPRETRERFPGVGTILERYAQVFNAVEVNSSFYRPHRPDTYRKWAASVPRGFLFSVKVPKAITHDARLDHTEALLDRFLDECQSLDEKLGPLLVQMPPSLKFELAVAERFFADLRRRFVGEVVVEPRHATWFSPDGAELFDEFELDLVAADPQVKGYQPQPTRRIGYRRLHGVPKIYYSDYDSASLLRIGNELIDVAKDAGRSVWCIFDNTAVGHATNNALLILDRTKPLSQRSLDFGLEAVR